VIRRSSSAQVRDCCGTANVACYKESMVRHGRPAIAGVVALLVVTGCTAGSPQDRHSALVCKRFATAVSRERWPKNLHPLGLAEVPAQKALRRPGYYSASFARALRALLTTQSIHDVKVFTADCRALGVKGPVFEFPGSY
jgi:hypothetical protein